MKKKINQDSIKVSKFMWEEEKRAMLDSNSPSEAQESGIIEVLDPLIESGKVLYEDFVDQIATRLALYTLKDVYPDTIKGRKELVKQVYTDLTNYYKQF